LIAQLEQVQELQPVLVLVLQLAQVLESGLVLELAQVLVFQPAPVLESGPVLESQLALVQVQHPLHRPPQSRFQPQQSLLLQREFR
jgi:hypothetical protein